jgi:propanediol dehydratase large subunit
LGLRLALKGLTTYAETLSVYGTEHAFTDGDDTPWSKAFLASAYASRGVKIRFTSGTGSEALMGHAERCSMLYLEARCLLVTRGAGSQGVQNGSISCIALPESLPGGVRAVLAENLLAAMLGLEVASGNDALASHSAIRKTAKLMLQFIPGTDFICSGYSAVPKADNLFGGGNFDAEDFDDYNVLQRDMQVDGGVRPVTEDEVVAVRRKAAQAIQSVYAGLGFPPINDGEVEAAALAHSSDDMPERDVVADLAAADRFLAMETSPPCPPLPSPSLWAEAPSLHSGQALKAEGSGQALPGEGGVGASLPSQGGGRGVGTRFSGQALDMVAVAAALYRAGFADVAVNVLEMGRQRVAGDYLQPAAIFDAGFRVRSAINDPNDYAGPGTGYRLEGERWREVQGIPQVQSPRAFVAPHAGTPSPRLTEIGPARRGTRPEVIVAVGPAFNAGLTRTIGGLEHEEVLAAILSGIADEGLIGRVVKVYLITRHG